MSKTPELTTIRFTIQLTGTGKSVQECWDDAAESFHANHGDPPMIEITTQADEEYVERFEVVYGKRGIGHIIL